MLLKETALHRALVAHRQGHPECDRKCREYVEIARSFTSQRVIREGPVAPHTWLSIREAE